MLQTIMLKYESMGWRWSEMKIAFDLCYKEHKISRKGNLNTGVVVEENSCTGKRIDDG